MNGFSQRDTVFLAEMGLGPLWQLRAAAGGELADAGDVLVEAAPAAAETPAPSVPAVPAPQVARPVPPVPQPVPSPAQAEVVQTRPQQVPAAAPAAAPAARSPAQPYQPPGPRPLQPVATTVSALAPDDSAWDDAALPSATPEEIAAMDWDQLAIAITTCRRCSACRDGRAPVPGTGARQARWLVAAGASTAADEKARVPLAGDPGKLLDNMLAAVGRSRQQDVYITNLIKCRPLSPTGAERAPNAEEAAACRPYLERELALSGAGTVLTLGQIAANTLLGRPLPEPLAGVRGQVHALNIGGAAPGEIKLVAMLHPGELLRRGADKAQAWADLCRARAAESGAANGGAVEAGAAGDDHG